MVNNETIDKLVTQEFSTFTQNSLKNTHPDYKKIEAAEISMLAEIIHQLRAGEGSSVNNNKVWRQTCTSLGQAYIKAGLADGEKTAQCKVAAFVEKVQDAINPSQALSCPS